MISILLLLFQYKPVQTWAAKKAAGYLSEKLHTTVDIKGLYIQPFSSVVIDSLTVLDLQKDTLLNAPKLTVDINGFSLFSSFKTRQLDLTKIEFDKGSFYLKKQKGGSNLQFIINYFNSPDTTKPATPSKPWQVKFEKVVFNKFHFRYKNMLKDTFMRQVNFDDVDLHGHFIRPLSALCI